METLTNCEIIINIEMIEKVSGGNQQFEVYVQTSDRIRYKIIFDSVWDIRCSIENATIDRFSKFHRNVKEISSVLCVDNSDYIKYFEKQSSGTRPTSKLMDYIIYDKIDSVVEVITNDKPTIIKA